MRFKIYNLELHYTTISYNRIIAMFFDVAEF